MNSVILEQITQEEFDRIHEFWYPGKKEDVEPMCFARIISPIRASHCEELLQRFRDSGQACKISFSGNGVWNRLSIPITDDDIARVVSYQGRFRQGDLELYFHQDDSYHWDSYGEVTPHMQSKVRFDRGGSRFHSYSMLIPNIHRHIVQWKSRPSTHKMNIYALIDPGIVSAT